MTSRVTSSQQEIQSDAENVHPQALLRAGSNASIISDDWVCDALLLSLRADDSRSLQRALYMDLRQMMEKGKLPEGTRLPSTRYLAKRLNIARNTALMALEQLAHEGFIETRTGAGSFVANSFDVVEKQQGANGELGRSDNLSSAVSDEEGEEALLSTRGRNIYPLRQLSVEDRPTAFTPGLPALSLFPWEYWRRLQQRHWRRPPIEWLGYQNEGGLPRLREVLCDYLTLSRSVQCEPDQIVITQGAQQAFSLISTLLAEEGDNVWFENPGYRGARAAFEASGLKLVPVEVDNEGMVPNTALEVPKLIYITPSYQFPCAVTLSMQRRKELITYAEKTGAWIIEDDYDSEFRYDAKPLSSLQGLGGANQVIYVGTFSKVMYPGLGLGYMVLPRRLVAPFRQVASRLMRDSNYPLQAAVAEFIADGAFRQHIRRCRKVYERRQSLLRHHLQPAVERGLVLSSGQAGMHILATHPKGIDERKLQEWGRQEGVFLSPLSSHFIQTEEETGRPNVSPDPQRTGFVLGYAAAEDELLIRASGLLNRWLEQTGR